ncbi:MAG: hypothetical protein J5836_00815 [Clostridia bacterium]|nr:hypothetical protein [Clostridia bacterium]
MKKLQEILKPFLPVIFGALLLLFYLNWLSYAGLGLVLGILAVILAAYNLAVGITSVIMSDKLSPSAKKALSAVSVGSFAVFMFLYFLFITIAGADGFGPNGWVIALLGMIVSLFMSATYFAGAFANVPALKKLSQLASLLFVLVLILKVLFDATGDPVNLGAINVVEFAIYFIYTNILFSSIAADGAKAE